MVFSNITYNIEVTGAIAQESVDDENIEVTSRTKEEKARDGIEKINNGEELLEEEIEAIDNLYKELTIELPQDSVEWEVRYMEVIHILFLNHVEINIEVIMIHQTLF